MQSWQYIYSAMYEMIKFISLILGMLNGRMPTAFFTTMIQLLEG